MRKKVFIGVLVVLSLLLVGGVFAMADQEATTAQIDKTWELTAQTIEDIYIGGTNQPVHLILETTDNPDTQVVVSGKVPERSLESLVDPDYTMIGADRLHLAFEAWNSGFGTGHIEFNKKQREEVTVRIQLGRGSVLKSLGLDNSSGDVRLTLPVNLAATYDLTVNGNGQVVNQPNSVEAAETVLDISTVDGDIVVD